MIIIIFNSINLYEKTKWLTSMRISLGTCVVFVGRLWLEWTPEKILQPTVRKQFFKKNTAIASVIVCAKRFRWDPVGYLLLLLLQERHGNFLQVGPARRPVAVGGGVRFRCKSGSSYYLVLSPGTADPETGFQHLFAIAKPPPVRLFDFLCIKLDFSWANDFPTREKIHRCRIHWPVRFSSHDRRHHFVLLCTYTKSIQSLVVWWTIVDNVTLFPIALIFYFTILF